MAIHFNNPEINRRGSFIKTNNHISSYKDRKKLMGGKISVVLLYFGTVFLFLIGPNKMGGKFLMEILVFIAVLCNCSGPESMGR